MTADEDREYPHRLGRIIRAHGLRGDVLVQLFRARPIEEHWLRFQKDPEPRPVELVHPDDFSEVRRVLGVRWTSPSSFVAHLEGVDTREEAERRIKAMFDVDPLHAPAHMLDEVDEVFGAEVVDVESGDSLGTIDDIRDNGAQALLVIGPDELLIPWVDAFVVGVEPGPPPKVSVRPIPGLLDVNRS